ncbi:MAG: hypothetical protein EOO75_03470 [Myxococcales bacterium]|nr:MAG: hypothetical protein EOO75_03470 [Myxococcales bacterium]
MPRAFPCNHRLFRFDMTFTEAAAEVLRLVGKPLHYKEITDLAIQKNLLSHVGKSPEETMGARLAQLLKKSPKENPLVRLKSGVFALRTWDEGKFPGPSEDCDFLPPFGPGPRKAAPPPPPAPRATEPVARPVADVEPREPREPREPAEREPAAARADRGTDRRSRAGRGRLRTEASVAAEAPAEAVEAAIEAPIDPDKNVGHPLVHEMAPVAAVDARLLSSDERPGATVGEPPSEVSSGAESQDEVSHARDEDEETTRLALSALAPLATGPAGSDDAAIAEATAEAPPAPSERRGRGRDGRDGRRRSEERPARPASAPAAPGRGKRDEVAESEPLLTQPAPDELLRADLAAAATEVFAEEDDDDQPILGGEPASEPGGRRRRRRRRGGRADAGGHPEGASDGLPSYTVSPAFDGSDARASDEPRAARASDEPRDERRPGESRGEEPRRDESRRRDGRGEARGEGRGESRGESRTETRGESRGEERREGRGESRGEVSGEASATIEGDEVVGRDMVELLLNALGGFDRSGGLVPVRNVAEALLRRGRVGGEVGQVTSMALAAARADNLRRQSEHKRARFRLAGGRIGLTDWALNPELLRLEGEALAAMERYRDGARRVLARKLGELPAAGFVELTITVLERLGISQLRTIKRQGASAAEVQLTGVHKGPGGETRVAVIVRKDAREIGRERVIEARGSLHHFAPATSLWLVTSGQVLSGAREEAQAAGAAPVALLDGLGLARLCEEHGLGVVKTDVAVALPDLEFFEQLRGGN